MPVILGNCVTYDVTVNLLKAGAAGILVGIGPGAACTSRGVLGVGVPQATAVADCAAAKTIFTKKRVNMSLLSLMVALLPVVIFVNVSPVVLMP